jgi:hypothetical protein
VTRGNTTGCTRATCYAAAAAAARPQDCYPRRFAASYDAAPRTSASPVGTAGRATGSSGLDSNDGETTACWREGELDYLAEQLAKGEATDPAVPPPGQRPRGDHDAAARASAGLEPDDAKAFRDCSRSTTTCAGVYAGHTHRNTRATSTETGACPFFEGGA